MAYSSGGLISATDYNNLAWGGTQGTYTAAPANIAYVMGIGTDAVGYGQDVTAINTVASTAVVTATQWSGLLTKLNAALGHQSGAGAVLSGNYTAGQTITYFANVNTAVTTINTNLASFAAQGATVTGANFANGITAGAGVAYAADFVQRTVSFASGDAARYFFNAGGQLNLVISSVTNNNGTARSGDAVTLIGTMFGGLTALRNNSNGGRTGAGGTLVTNDTAAGYRQLPASLITNHFRITSTTASYTTDNFYLRMFTSAQNASGHGDHGLQIVFSMYLDSPGHSAFDSALNVTVNNRIDVVLPESTYLTTNSWGTPTIA